MQHTKEECAYLVHCAQLSATRSPEPRRERWRKNPLSPLNPQRRSYSSAMMRFVRLFTSALARSTSSVGHAPSRYTTRPSHIVRHTSVP